MKLNNPTVHEKDSDSVYIIQDNETSSEYKLYRGKYRHYKGQLYEVLGVCTHTETEEKLVYYQSLYGDFAFWVRPIKKFFEMVYYNGNLHPRFSKESF